MANFWFRMYAEFVNDPKVQMLTETDQRRYIMLLCIRCSNDHVTLQDEEVTFMLRISNESWLQTKAVLLSKNLINEHNFPTNWDKRQYASDSSKDRVAKFRANKKQINSIDNEDVTKCNADVTLQKQASNAIEKNRVEKNRVDINKSFNKDLSAQEQKEFEETFLQFWESYPKKRGKAEAMKAWLKLKPDERLTAVIFTAVSKAKTQDAQWLKDNGIYIPDPTTYLNQKRWEDEIISLAKPAQADVSLPRRRVI